MEIEAIQNCVDGNNELELEELEMCVISMNPKADVQPEDIKRVWDVLNPEGKEWIPFAEYVQGPNVRTSTS